MVATAALTSLGTTSPLYICEHSRGSAFHERGNLNEATSSQAKALQTWQEGVAVAVILSDLNIAKKGGGMMREAQLAKQDASYIDPSAL